MGLQLKSGAVNGVDEGGTHPPHSIVAARFAQLPSHRVARHGVTTGSVVKSGMAAPPRADAAPRVHTLTTLVHAVKAVLARWDPFDRALHDESINEAATVGAQIPHLVYDRVSWHGPPPVFADQRVEGHYLTYLANEMDRITILVFPAGVITGIAFLAQDIQDGSPSGAQFTSRIIIRSFLLGVFVVSFFLFLLRRRAPARMQLWLRTLLPIALTILIHARLAADTTSTTVTDANGVATTKISKSFFRGVGVWSLALKAAVAMVDVGFYRICMFNTIDSAADIVVAGIMTDGGAYDAPGINTAFRWQAVVWVWFNAYAIFQDWRMRRGFVRLCELHLARRLTLEASELYRFLTDSTLDMICVHSLQREGEILYCSRGSVTLTGFEPAELVGLLPADYVHEDDAREARALYTVDEARTARSFMNVPLDSRPGAFFHLREDESSACDSAAAEDASGGGVGGAGSMPQASTGCCTLTSAAASTLPTTTSVNSTAGRSVLLGGGPSVISSTYAASARPPLNSYTNTRTTMTTMATGAEGRAGLQFGDLARLERDGNGSLTMAVTTAAAAAPGATVGSDLEVRLARGPLTPVVASKHAPTAPAATADGSTTSAATAAASRVLPPIPSAPESVSGGHGDASSSADVVDVQVPVDEERVRVPIIVADSNTEVSVNPTAAAASPTMGSGETPHAPLASMHVSSALTSSSGASNGVRQRPTLRRQDDNPRHDMRYIRFRTKEGGWVKLEVTRNQTSQGIVCVYRDATSHR